MIFDGDDIWTRVGNRIGVGPSVVKLMFYITEYTLALLILRALVV